MVSKKVLHLHLRTNQRNMTTIRIEEVKKTDVAGQEYCVAYSPIKDDKGSVIGMAFAGKPRASIEAGIKKSVTTVIIIGMIIILISIIVIYILASKFVKALNSAKEVIDKLSRGEFEETTDYINRNDELGDMIRNSNTLSKMFEPVPGFSGSSGGGSYPPSPGF